MHTEAVLELDFVKQQCEETLRDLEADNEDAEEQDLLSSNGLLNERVFCCEPIELQDISAIGLPSDQTFKELLEIESTLTESPEDRLWTMFVRGTLVSCSIACGHTASSTSRWLFNVISKCKDGKLVEGALDNYSALVKASIARYGRHSSSIWVPLAEDILNCLYSYGYRSKVEMLEEDINQ